jgi:copper(I)-binding protein
MKKLLFALIAAIAFVPAHAQLSVTGPWVRATVPQQQSTGAFMQLTAARALRLVQVSSPAAGSVEIHQMEMKDQMMRMHPVDGLDLPAGQPVDLAAGGYHIMLLDLKQPLKEGDKVTLVLTLQGKDSKRETVTVSAPVKPINTSAKTAKH